MRTLVIALVLAAGCSKDNANYCASAPDHNCSEMVDAPGGGGDGAMGCASATDCTSSSAPVCDTGKHECVACSAGEIGACAGTTPVCDTASETCHQCVAHADCGSPGACLPDGSCGTDANVAWVASGATGACTHGAPCGSIAQALALNLPYVKLATGTYAEAVSVSRSVTMLADSGARLTAAGGTALAVHGTSTVTVHDLRIAGSSLGVTVGAGEGSIVALDHVIVDDNTSTGLYISSGTLSMSRCVVSGNAGGGANVSATFHISNSIFVANGSGTSTTGGVTLSPASSSEFTFNTVADNLSTSGTSTVRGINCTIPMAVASSILTGNAVSGNCTVDYSLFDTGTATAHNKIGAPMFANVDPADPTAGNYYRVQSTSAAIDSADPASSLSDDIDEHHRPIGNTFDIGASEFKP